MKTMPRTQHSMGINPDLPLVETGLSVDHENNASTGGGLHVKESCTYHSEPVPCAQARPE